MSVEVPEATTFPISQSDAVSLDQGCFDLLETRLAVLNASQGERFPYSVDVLGVPLLIRSGVFSPKYFESSEVFASMLKIGQGERFLDTGCGCGLAAIYAARNGAARALATDISDDALRNAQENVDINHVASIVEVRKSNVFDRISRNERFDVIFWNPPWVWAPASYQLRSPLEASVCDPGYRSIEAYLANASVYLRPGGRLLLGMGSFANWRMFEGLMRKYRYRSVSVGRRKSRRHPEFEFQFLSLEKSQKRPW